MADPTEFDDILIGTKDPDIIHALGGNDIIDGKEGNDDLFGDAGNDTFLYTGGWDDTDTVDGGADIDTMDFSGVDFTLMSGGLPGDTVTGFVYVDLTAGNYGRSVTFTPSGNFAVSIAKVSNVENVIGSSGNDFITGDAKDNRITGGFGNDTLAGGGGNDTFLMTGSYFDADKVDGGDGINTLDMSGVDYSSIDPGDPNAVFSAGTYVDLSAGNFGGTYSITYPDAWVAYGSVSTVTNVSNVVGSKYNDTITGNRLWNVIEGGAGDDVMSGGRGRDTFKFYGAYLDADTVNGGDDPVASDHDTLDFSGVDLRPLETQGFATQLTVDLTAGSFGAVLSFDANGAFIRFGPSATVTEVEDVIGSAFDDSIKGNTGANRLDGGDGNDLIDGGEGADTLIGGKGNDTYRVAGSGAIIIENADEGTDLVKAFSIAHTLADNVENLEMNGRAKGVFKGIGNADANVITSNLSSPLFAGRFELSGGGGNDTLRGNKNADKLDGGKGDDLMSGGAGNDEYAVDSHGDEVVELDDGGTDTVVVLNLNGYTLGANVENLLLGVSAGIADGDYTATGNELDNAMAGVALDTGIRLFGLGGNDQLRGANLAGFVDILDGGEGADKLYGQAGNDLLRGGDGNDHLDGGTGNDTADYSLAASGVTVDMSKTIEGLGGEALGDNFVSIENVTGSDFADTITGNTGANVLKGGDGDDVLTGGAGKDVLDGGSGDDTLFADNLDTIIGGSGRDMVFANSGTIATGFKFNLAGTNVEYVSGNAGKDTFDATTNTATFFHLEFFGNGGNDTLLGGSGLEYFWGGQGSDTFVFSGNFADYTITKDVDLGPWSGWTYIEKTGSSGGDWFISVETLQFADQTIAAPDSYVQFNGTAGADTRTGTIARDEMYGGAGNDVLSGDGGTDILTGGAGKDTLSGGEGNDALFIDNADIVSGGGGFDTAYADDSQGPLGLNFTVGSTGIEAVWGGRGGDVIDASGAPGSIGGVGVALYGNAGGDQLIGSAFIDLIEGGLGDDTLTGGAGNDSFVFDFNVPGGGRDTITDFEDGFDTLDIWDPAANAYLGFADVTVADSVAGAVITYARGEIVLQGITASQIDQDDFVV